MRLLFNGAMSFNFYRFAANKCVIRDVANRFGMGISTFHRCAERVMDYLIDISPKIIKFPETEKEKEEAAASFEQIKYIAMLSTI